MPFLDGFRGPVDLRATVSPNEPKNEKSANNEPGCDPWIGLPDAVAACEKLKADYKTSNNEAIGQDDEHDNRQGTPFDISQLCRAIAEHETHNCRDKTNSTAVNNCHGFRTSQGFMRFKTKTESYAKCEDLWMNSGLYSGGMPTLEDAQRYSGNDRAQTWLKNVTYFYYNLK